MASPLSSAVLCKAAKGSSAGRAFSALSVSLTFSGFSRKSSSAPTLAACSAQPAFQSIDMHAVRCSRTVCDRSCFACSDYGVAALSQALCLREEP